jgi:hypothetical protein
MRRFYVVPHDVWNGHTQIDDRKIKHIDLFHPEIGSCGIHLFDYTSPEHEALLHAESDTMLSVHGVGPAEWEALPEVQEWRQKGSLMLLSTDFRTEDPEAIWHAHPEVARLQHPALEGTITLDDLHQKPQHAHKQFRRRHLDALSVLGIRGHHTILDVHTLAKAKDPGCRLGAFW